MVVSAGKVQANHLWVPIWDLHFGWHQPLQNLVISSGSKKKNTVNHFKEPILKSILIPTYEEICWQMFQLLGLV